jgi:hypothetical protein
MAAATFCMIDLAFVTASPGRLSIAHERRSFRDAVDIRLR